MRARWIQKKERNSPSANKNMLSHIVLEGPKVSSSDFDMHYPAPERTAHISLSAQRPILKAIFTKPVELAILLINKAWWIFLTWFPRVSLTADYILTIYFSLEDHIYKNDRVIFWLYFYLRFNLDVRDCFRLQQVSYSAPKLLFSHDLNQRKSCESSWCMSNALTPHIAFLVPRVWYDLNI